MEGRRDGGTEGRMEALSQALPTSLPPSLRPLPPLSFSPQAWQLGWRWLGPPVPRAPLPQPPSATRWPVRAPAGGQMAWTSVPLPAWSCGEEWAMLSVMMLNSCQIDRDAATIEQADSSGATSKQQQMRLNGCAWEVRSICSRHSRSAFRAAATCAPAASARASAAHISCKRS